jgi:hypothetical protein
VKVEVDPEEVDALIDRGYLQPKDRDDREVLAAAVTTFFSDANDAVTASLLARCNTVTNAVARSFALDFFRWRFDLCGFGRSAVILADEAPQVVALGKRFTWPVASTLST